MAAVDPDGFPSHVAPDELIESAWGNATVDNLHRIDEKVDLNWGNQATRDTGQDSRMTAIEGVNTTQNGRLTTAESNISHLLNDYADGWKGHGFSGTVQQGIQQAYVALTGMKVDFTETPGKYYLVLASCAFSKAGADVDADVEMIVQVVGGATTSGYARSFCRANGFVTLTSIGIYAGTASRPNNVQAVALTPAGFVNANQRTIVVVDIGSSNP